MAFGVFLALMGAALYLLEHTEPQRARVVDWWRAFLAGRSDVFAGAVAVVLGMLVGLMLAWI